MESIWTKTCRMPAFPSLSSDMDVDVAVVGGGMAGILIAYFLKDSGLSVAVFEKDAIGRGATAFTTAKITSQHGLIYTKLIQNENMVKEILARVPKGTEEVNEKAFAGGVAAARAL